MQLRKVQEENGLSARDQCPLLLRVGAGPATPQLYSLLAVDLQGHGFQQHLGAHGTHSSPHRLVNFSGVGEVWGET